MTKKISTFTADAYRLSGGEDGAFILKITGRKLGPPNKRIILNQKGLKVVSAQISSTQKGMQIEHAVIRINHLPTFEQVRLHTGSALYPGIYIVYIQFTARQNAQQVAADSEKIKRAGLRNYFPATDGPGANPEAAIEIKT